MPCRAGGGPELVLAPARIALADRLDRAQLLDRPGRPTPPARRRAAVLEGLEAERGRTAPSQRYTVGRPIAEVAGGPADVAAVGPVPVEHRQAAPGVRD